MNTRHKRRLFAAACVLLLIAGSHALWQQYRANRRAAAHAVIVDGLLDVSDLRADPDRPSRTFDAARTFVADHSQHRIDDAFYTLWRDPNRIAAAVLAHARGELSEKPHLECSTRTSVLDAVLRHLGYDTRMVVIFDVGNALASHTFLEAHNPRTSRWEIIDADYDIHWRMRTSGARASIVDILRNVDEVEPCGRQGCGWDVANAENQVPSFLRSYLRLASIIDKERDARVTLYARDVDPAARYRQGEREGTFCKLIRKNCRSGFMPAASFEDD